MVYVRLFHLRSLPTGGVSESRHLLDLLPRHRHRALAQPPDLGIECFAKR